MTGKRSPVVAAIASAVVPGLGQMYNGQLAKAIVCGLVSLVPSVLSAAFRLLDHFIGLVVLACVAVAVRVYVIVDALRTSVTAAEFTPRPHNRWFYYLIFIAAVFVASQVTGTLMISLSGVKAYIIPTKSMEPTVLQRDHMIVETRYGYDRPVARGEIVVVRETIGTLKVRRAVALANDTVLIVQKQLYVNGEKVVEPYAIYEDSKVFPPINKSVTVSEFQRRRAAVQYAGEPGVRDNFGPVVIPKDCYFVMGDNRDWSLDSRFLGPLGKTSITGKPLYIYLSPNLRRIGMRF